MSGYLSLADGRCLPIRDGFVIGRTAECDLSIDDGKASRRHARIAVEAGVVEIEDLGSSNGTLLNGKPVARRLLREGDEVQIGKTVITYREGAVPGASGTGAAAASATRRAEVVDDDNDLFGGDAPATEIRAPLAPARPQAPIPVPEPAAPSVRSTPAAALPPAPPVPRPSVVEFADEVVEVRKPAATAAAAKAPAASGGAPVLQQQQRVLQFSKQASGGGVLGDDLSQISGGTRSLIYAVVLAAAVALAWFVMRLVG